MPVLPFVLAAPLGIPAALPTPIELFDLVPGNIGLLGDSVIMLRFDEPTGVLPSDEAERLNDLGIESGIAIPVVAETFCGLGRTFVQASDNALIAGDRSTLSATVLPRDASIMALISLTLAGASGPQTIIARGINDGTIPERYAYGLEVVGTAGSPGSFDVRWFWSDASGTVITADAATFEHAGDGAEIMLTATRRVEGPSVIVRYYIDSRIIGEFDVTSTISGGVSGTTTIGGRKSAGAWSRFLNGTIDELQVVNYELTADEVRTTWERLTVHQPAGLEAFKGLAPPGVGWFNNLSSDIARRAKVVGQAIGLFISHVEELRSTFLPGKCAPWLLPRWEDLYAIFPMPLDSIDLRRARVLARMAAEEGYSIPQLQTAFSLLFGLDPASVEILELSNEWTDTFDGTDIIAERWQSGSVGAFAIIPSLHQLSIDVADSLDINQSPTLGDCRLWTPLDRTDGGQVFFAAKVVDFDMPHGSFVGLMLHRRVGSRTLWFGIYNNAGVFEIATCEGTMSGGFSAITSLATVTVGPLWLRINLGAGDDTFLGNDTLTLTLSWSTTGPTSGFTNHDTTAYRWYDLAGFGAFTTITTAFELGMTFDDAHVYVPQGLAPFAWFAYRDPALDGTYDLINANALARKVSPAHMYGAACASKRFLFGDPVAGLIGSTPWGWV